MVKFYELTWSIFTDLVTHDITNYHIVQTIVLTFLMLSSQTVKYLSHQTFKHYSMAIASQLQAHDERQ